MKDTAIEYSAGLSEGRTDRIMDLWPAAPKNAREFLDQLAPFVKGFRKQLQDRPHRAFSVGYVRGYRGA